MKGVIASAVIAAVIVAGYRDPSGDRKSVLYGAVSSDLF